MAKDSLQKLYTLIHSLTKTEKRYISIELAKQTSRKGKIDALLFNALKVQKNLDEGALARKPPFRNRKELIIRKNYLFDFILRCLIDYNYSHDIEIDIGNNIRIIKNLIIKGLHQYTGYYITRAQSLAEKCEDLYRMGTILSLRKIIVNRSSNSYSDYMKELQKIESEENGLYEKVINLNQYNIAANHLTLILKKDSATRTGSEEARNISDLAASPLFADEKNALTRKAKIIYHHVRATFAERVDHNPKKALSHTEKQLGHIRELEIYRKSNSTSYITCLKRLCIFAAQTGSFTKAGEALNALRHMYEDRSVSHNNFERYFIFQNFMEAETQLSFTDRKFQRFTLMLPKVEEGMQVFRSMFDSESKMVLYYTIATRLMYLHDHKKAFRWLENIFAEEQGMRMDILHSARICSLVCIYEMDDLSLFESRTRSYLRYYHSHPDTSGRHPKIIQYLSQTYRNKTDGAYHAQLLTDFSNYLGSVNWQGQVETIFHDLLKTWMKGKAKKQETAAEIK